MSWLQMCSSATRKRLFREMAMMEPAPSPERELRRIIFHMRPSEPACFTALSSPSAGAALRLRMTCTRVIATPTDSTKMRASRLSLHGARHARASRSHGGPAPAIAFWRSPGARGRARSPVLGAEPEAPVLKARSPELRARTQLGASELGVHSEKDKRDLLRQLRPPRGPTEELAYQLHVTLKYEALIVYGRARAHHHSSQTTAQTHTALGLWVLSLPFNRVGAQFRHFFLSSHFSVEFYLKRFCF
eukprot:SAG22_NODE_19_length_32182_cov_39.206963_6_plen_246_part_00